MRELLIQEKTSYLLADREFYEPLSIYKEKTSDYIEPIKRHIPYDWSLTRSTVWIYCSPVKPTMPTQGWKIHISATPAHAAAILVTAAQILCKTATPFKFIADRPLLMLTNGKQWPRASSGKFITIYPRDLIQCKQLLEQLHQATISYRGPYILSDRRYRDSNIIFYRYGGFAPTKRIDVDGRPIYLLRTADGTYLDDIRTPYFSVPDGIADPFQNHNKLRRSETAEGPKGNEPGTLKYGQYKIENAISHTNTGGVYIAINRRNNQRVIIKEARPFTNISLRGLDAVQLLKKEHRLLSLLDGSGIAPRALDFFMDWEHAYLVEEYLSESMTLRMLFSSISPAIRTRFDSNYLNNYFQIFTSVFYKVYAHIRHLHEKNIIFSDLSINNILSNRNGDNVHLIDFEGAHEEGVDIPPTLFTDGFAPQDLTQGRPSRRSDDYYALGSLMLASLFPMNSLLSLSHESYKLFLDSHKTEFGLPSEIAQLIIDLMNTNKGGDVNHSNITRVLSNKYEINMPSRTITHLDSINLSQHIKKLIRFTKSAATYNRHDRLYPADPAVYETNPLSIAYGACGVAYVMHHIDGYIDQEAQAWIDAHLKDAASYPPGLYSGLCGIAWTLLETDHLYEARNILSLTTDHILLSRSPDLFSGTAGWGMTQLRFYLQTQDSVYLTLARHAGDLLLRCSNVDDAGLRYWNTPEGVSPSFAHGNSGICLFLLYLSLATQTDVYIEAGQEGMNWVLAQAHKSNDGGMSWRPYPDMPTYTPYWRWGSSGIGRALIRYWQTTRNKGFENAISEAVIDCDRKYAIFPGYFFGLAGIADFLLDLKQHEKWKDISQHAVRRILDGCLLFSLPRSDGMAYPGESLHRISCDFGTGSAGIAWVMHRYQTQCDAAFMLDSLLPNQP
ncbi:class III lanthionine synthetase LanKC [Frateuria aurantia]